ncbi:hypothetical protein pEaSNUABM29_00004 [Erwinia phage pEa_SNUABM_29]|nr:hypothetical protein pEaSNUABM29_00004 [Erwinia phage pEa_SNUABM_29]
MQFYSKEALQLVYDQVNRDNPNLPVKLTPANTALTSGPVARSANGRNTEVKFTAYPGSGLIGTLTLNYDRVLLSNLWSSSLRPVLYFSSDIKSIADALPIINDALGITLRPDEVSNLTTAINPNATKQDAQLNVTAACAAFTGSLYFSYQTEQIGYYPNSGPGPKYLLAGDTLMGYFGRVTAAEFIARQAFVTATGLTGYTQYVGGNEGWYKFYYQGSVVYIPVSPVASNISWQMIYQAGMAYGTDNNGKYSYPVASPVNQSKIIPIQTPEGRFYIRPRLPTSTMNDPDTVTTSPPTAAQYAGSILGMMIKVRNGEWESNTSGEWTAYIVCQNTMSTNTTNHRLATMASTIWNAVQKGLAATTQYWWPVVELVDTSSNTIALQDIIGRMDYTVTAPVTRTENLLMLAPPVFGLPGTVDITPAPARTENQLAIAPVSLGLPKTLDYTPAPVKTEAYTAPAKTNLSTTNGELNGFK